MEEVRKGTRCSPWHLFKTEAGVPQALGRAYTRVLLIGNCVCFENMAAQTQSTTAGLPTEVFTSPQQVLEG